MHRFVSGLSAAALALLCAGPSLAQTRAADLWAEWQAQAAQSDQTLTATVTETAGGLTLTDFVSVTDEDGMSIRGNLERIEMTENPDGSVGIIMSQPYRVVFTFETDPGEPDANIELILEHENLVITASGTSEARRYVYSADEVSISEGRIWGGGDTPPVIDLSLVMSDLVTDYTLGGAGTDAIDLASAGSIGRLSLILDVTGPANDPGRLKAGLLITGLESTATMSVASLAALAAAGDSFPPGLVLSGVTTYSQFNIEFAFEDPFTSFMAVSTNAGGNIGLDFSESGIGYDIAARSVSTRLSGADIPAPVEFSVGSSQLLLSVPLALDPEPQEFVARLAYEGVTLSDSVWTLFDSSAVIPRDPASVIIDLGGQLQILADLMTLDPETMTAPPAEIRSLSVSELRLDLAGAELTGTADLTFAPGQLMPTPEGSADLRLSGGNALLDALMAGGLVPAQEGAFVRGAANIFARPGAAPDTLETTIVFGADGTITANGIPVQ